MTHLEVVLSYLGQWDYEVTLSDIIPLRPILGLLQIGFRARFRSWVVGRVGNRAESRNGGMWVGERVKGTNVVSYTQYFQELALMCGRMFSEESNDVDKRSLHLLKDKLRRKGGLITTTKLNNNLPRSKMWQGFILLGLVRRRSMPRLYRCATSASFTTMARAL
ncbi:hypothetical protein Tco_1291132 [Tanacetum coccineum]